MSGLSVIKSRIRALRRWILGADPEPDYYLASFPKSGRTWLSFFLADYLSRRFDLGLGVDMHSMYEIVPSDGARQARPCGAWLKGEIPRIWATHSAFRREFSGHPLVFVSRSPLDVMVSFYFHQLKHRYRFEGSIKDFIRSEEHGMPHYVRWMSSWRRQLAAGASIHVSYEQMADDFADVARRVLEFLELPIDRDLLAQSADAASFDNMSRVELGGRRIPGHDYDRSDVDARRMRRGVVGGYESHLDASDVEYILGFGNGS